MTRALPVWGSVESRGKVSGSSKSPSVNVRDVKADGLRTSAEIVRLGKCRLPQLRENLRRDQARLFWATFDGASLHAKCEDAARKIAGVSSDTFARIAGCETDKIDLALVQVMLAWHYQKHGSVDAFPGLVMRGVVS